MLREEIIEKLRKVYVVITSENKTDALTEQSDLRTDLGLSSIGMLYLVIAIEETFNIRFENVSMGDFVTIKDVIDYIQNRLDANEMGA